MLDRETTSKLLDQKLYCLKPCAGRVLSINTFIKQNIRSATEPQTLCFEPEEKELLNNFAKIFLEVPKEISQAYELAPEAGKNIKIYPMGSRSAYWSKACFKFKGCRPTIGHSFPHSKLEFGQTQSINESIPFGTLTAESILREILGYCFFIKNDIPVLQRPVAVIHYDTSGPEQYCLVLQGPHDLRLEREEDDHGLTIRDCIYLSAIENELGGNLFPKEPHFKTSISWQQYIQMKSKILTKMNFSGGFRGHLNSNMGNEMFLDKTFYLCDFDSFKVIALKEIKAANFFKNFMLWSVLEALKSSPTVLKFCDLSQIARATHYVALWETYVANSEFWKCYFSCFKQHCEILGISERQVNDTLHQIVAMPILKDAIYDCVLNSYVLETTYPNELSFYRGQS